MTTLVEEVALWIARLRYEELPPEVIAKAKRVLLDTVGCALGALEAVPVRMARQVVREQGASPHATPAGVRWKTSCEQAAFINGMEIRYLDFNDYAASGNPHHASINVAPALSVAEAQGLSGKDLLLGITVGYEVQLRLRDASAKGKLNKWDHSTTVPYSAAAVAGKLLGLTPLKMAHALAIAGIHASTLAEVRRGKLSIWKGAAEPMGARNGTFAALLAQAGLTGPLTILEGKYGYGKVVAGALDVELLRERSGDFQILKSCTKVWPCLFVAQAPIAAALKIRSQGLAPGEIKKVTVGLGDFGYKNQRRFLKREISTREDADHSVPYCVARVFLDGEVRAHHFEEGAFKDPRALELVKKVSLRRDPSLTALCPEITGANVEVRLRNGNILRAEIPHPPGHAQNPLSEGETVKKFLDLAEGSLGRERAHRAAQMILRVDELSNIGVLGDAICAAGGVD
ncbi:MAG: MmgE/PrpD family protein [Candidatus Binatia bacterium]